MAKILLVDDDDAVRLTLSLMIEALGHEVVAVSNTIDAMGAAETAMVDLAFVDMNMPGLDGLEAVKALTHMERRFPIIGMSGGSPATSLEDYAVLSVRIGAAIFLPKPFTRDRLSEAIVEVL